MSFVQPERPERRRRAVALVAGGGLLTLIAWIATARPDASSFSASGFDQGGAGVFLSPRDSKARLTPLRGAMELAASPAPLFDSAEQPALAAAPAPSEKGGPLAPDAPEPEPEPERPQPRELAAAGAPSDEAGLSGAGRPERFLGVVTGALAHPRVLRFLLNNKRLNDALFSDRLSDRRCKDAKAFQAYMSGADGRDPLNVHAVADAFSRVLERPGAARAVLESDFAARVVECPGIRAAASDPAAVLSIAQANPRLLGFLQDPRVYDSMSVNPEAARLLQSATAAAGPSPDLAGELAAKFGSR